jgi:predicted dehydrogenase
MRFGVIGTGIIGRLRAQTLHANPHTTLVAVADVDEASARATASPLGAAVHRDYQEMLGVSELDAVIISGPVQLHEEMCIAAFEAGCHVLCEKPLSNSLDSCRRIYAAAEAAGRTLAVGFNHRYFDSMKFARKVIDEGGIGKLDHIRAAGGHDGLGNFREPWMFQGPLSGGGAMMDIGIHVTDLARYLAGEITSVYGVATNGIWNVEGSEDNALAIFHTEAGVPIAYQATWTAWKGYEFYLEAYGDRGMVRAAYGPMYNLWIERDPKTGARRKHHRYYPGITVREKLRGWETTTRISFAEELADFLRMIRGEKVPLADGWSGLRSIEIANAVYRSSAERAPVTLSEPPVPVGAA